MTAKRFWYDFEDCTGAKFVDFQNDEKYSLETVGDFRQIEDLLNALHKENHELKQRFIDLANNILKDKICMKIYGNGLLELFDESETLDDARKKIKEFCELEDLE